MVRWPMTTPLKDSQETLCTGCWATVTQDESLRAYRNVARNIYCHDTKSGLHEVNGSSFPRSVELPPVAIKQEAERPRRENGYIVGCCYECRLAVECVAHKGCILAAGRAALKKAEAVQA